MISSSTAKLSAITLVVALFATVAHSKCFADIFRVVGSNDLYSVPCRCEGPDDYVGRSTVFLGDSPNTLAQARTTVECLRKSRHALNRACDRNVRQFEVEARHAIERCLRERPPKDAEGINSPFDYKKDECRAIFRRVDVEGLRQESVWVCACEQEPGYVVHPGVGQFFGMPSILGEGEEREFQKKCTMSELAKLTSTCQTDPARFELQSLQALNVCCKRLRVKFPKSKLDCQMTVPDDVTVSQLDVL